jgi:hypothetical protein
MFVTVKSLISMNKQNLPFKICPVCLRPFVWRKKWERDWEGVKYCSKKCVKNKSNE